MGSRYQKWVNLSFIAVAALFGFIVFQGGQYFVATFDLEARVRNADIILRVSSVLLSFLLFAVLYRRHDTQTFMGEVAEELSRVTWPTQKETAASTWIVIGMVLVSGVILALLDYVWVALIRAIL